MTIPDKIKDFLSDVDDITFGWSELTFLEPDKIKEGQVGYSTDPKGKSLIGDNDGDWKDGWLAIGTDELGDPIFLDINNPEYAVYTSANGEQGWEPFLIADSLDNFKTITSILEDVSEDRTDPEELQDNPISEEERHEVLKKIVQLSPDAEMWYWEQFLEDE